jgi:hypothetical protein
MNPFKKEFLKWLFEKSKADSTILARYENTEIEYKESFSFKGFRDYIRTFAGFANNNGGYMIFGVNDSPRKIVGLTSTRFDDLDQRKINQYFSEYLSAEIKWDCFLHKVDNKKCGLIYVNEVKNKPIIITKDAGNIKEGQIYYRYAGETKLIKSSELQNIISNRVIEERQKWQNLIGKLAKLSPEEVSVLNLKQGSIEEQGTNIILDEDTISKLKFIKEGEFSEKEGAPTLKLVGKVKEFSGKDVVINKEKPKTIHVNDIYNVFFTGSCNYPGEYLKQMAYENTYYLPMWFFIKLMDKDISYISSLFRELEDSIPNTQKELIKRLSNDSLERFVISSIYEDFTYDSSWKIENWETIKKEYKAKANVYGTKKVDRTIAAEILKNNPSLLLPIDDHLKDYFLEIIKAVTHLSQETLIKNQNAIIDVVNGIRKQIDNIETDLRKAICYLDYAYYGINLKNDE